jgi:toxin ParE1/3/4
MPRVRLSRQAQVDFDEIIAYLSDVAESGIARRYARDIRASIRRLAELPHIGPPRPELGANVRISIVSPYLILYDPDSFDGIVHVFRILHGSRNITRKMLRAGF